MKKNILFMLLFCLFSLISANAQKELWGTNSGPQFSDGYYGNILKLNINGENPVLIHEFDSINGYRPLGRLFQASNGKLYGTTKSGGNAFNVGAVNESSCGVLFEYDLILNKYKVLHYFNIDPLFIINTPINPEIGVIEPVIGQLYGATNQNIYRHDIVTGITTYFSSNSNVIYNISGELMKASDGNLYTVGRKQICPTTTDLILVNGAVLKFNMTTNILSVAHALVCDPVFEGLAPIGQLIEVSSGKLIGSTYKGGSYFTPTYDYKGSTIFEYNLNSTIFTKKFDLNLLTGINPIGLLNGGNGKFYGVCAEGGNSTLIPQAAQQSRGTLYEYTPSNNTLQVLKDFNSADFNVKYVTSIMKTSNGNFIGTMQGSNVFNYNPISDSITNEYGFMFPATNPLNFIEICRKPSYQEIIINTFTPAVGSTFTYNIQNTNATTYVWKSGTTILPLQTTGTLTLTNVTTNDTGVYTCTMTNECGTTVTANLNVTVTNLATETVDTYKSEISLYPNPTKSIINLKFPENRGLKGIQYKITNLLGQVVQEAPIVAGKSQVTIDASAFPVGVYQVTLTTDKGDWNGKFVRE